MRYGLSRAAVTAALVAFLSLILATAGPTPVPDSVRPCTPCHNRAGSDQVGEWLASPYSEKIGGRGCTDCHGDLLAGSVFWDDGAMGTLYASNLTGGRGGIANVYSDAAWVLAIRHGIGPDNRPLLFIPSHEY